MNIIGIYPHFQLEALYLYQIYCDFFGPCINLPSSHPYNIGIAWKVKVCCTRFFVY